MLVSLLSYWKNKRTVRKQVLSSFHCDFVDDKRKKEYFELAWRLTPSKNYTEVDKRFKLLVYLA